jgi:error-prone DNA polymerase
MHSLNTGATAAIAAAVSLYRPRGALRESGEALAIDLQIVDKVAKSHQWFDHSADCLCGTSAQRRRHR